MQMTFEASAADVLITHCGEGWISSKQAIVSFSNKYYKYMYASHFEGIYFYLDGYETEINSLNRKIKHYTIEELMWNLVKP